MAGSTHNHELNSEKTSEYTALLLYNKQIHLIPFALFSALAVVFYTTELSWLRSFHSPEHLQLFVFTAMLMYIAGLAVARISQWLDTKISWQQDPQKRGLVQFFLGFMGVAFVSLQLVYAIYELLLGINLRETPYLERDFVVVMSCLLGLNYHHRILYKRAYRRQLEQRLTKKKNQIDHLKQQVERLRLQLKEGVHKADKFRRARTTEEKDIAGELDMLYERLDNGQTVKAIQIAAFYISHKYKSSRPIHMMLWDGSTAIVKGADSLTSVENKHRYCFYRASRDFLVNRHAIAQVLSTTAGVHELHLCVPGAPPRQLSEEAYLRLSAQLM